MSFIKQSNLSLGGLKSVYIYNTSAPGGYDIGAAVIEFTFFQSLMGGLYSGKLTVVDEYDVLSNLLLIGNETCVIKVMFKNFQDKEVTVDIPMMLTGIEKYTRENDTAVYIINVSSLNMFNDITNRISQAYNGTTSDIIENILKDWYVLSEDKYNIEKTTDNMKVVIPNLRPSEAIRWITRRSVSQSGTPMFFYELLSGFRFKSFEEIAKEKPAFKYVRADSMSTLDIDRRYLINDIKANKLFRGAENIMNGMYSARVHAFDIVTKSFLFEPSFDIAESLESNRSFLNDVMYDSNLTIQGKTLNKFKDSKHFYMITSTGDESNADYIADYHSNAHIKVPQLNTKLTQLQNSLLDISIGGNLHLHPGMNINCTFMNTKTMVAQQTDEERYDRAISGNYMVLAVRHTFKLDSFTTVAQISKDSISSSPNAKALT